MSASNLDAALAALSSNPTAEALATVLAATGEWIKAPERAVLARWLFSQPRQTAAAQVLIRRFIAPLGAALEPVLSLALPVAEASGMTIGPGGVFWAVDDDRGLFEVIEGQARCLAPLRELGVTDLEGLCTGPNGTLLMVAEQGEVVEVHPISAAVRRLGRLPQVSTRPDKAYEGLDLLPAHHAPRRRPTVVAVNERDPAVVVLALLENLSDHEVLSLPADLVPRLDDLSDVTVHPETGDLLLLSDVSRTVARVRVVDGTRLETVGCWSLGIGRKLSPEGLAFDPAGQLWVAVDGASEVFAFWLPE